MIFAIGSVLFSIGYFWYRGSPNYGDWRDSVQFMFQVIGFILMMISLLILSVKYLP